MDSMAEGHMSAFHCRGSIIGTAVVIALLSSRPAAAQIGVDPGPPRERRSLCRDIITGAEYDVVNVELAQHRLRCYQEKLMRDSELGDMAAVNDDLRRIGNVRYRIAIHEWLILWNSRQYPCFYPIRTDECSLEAIAQAATPTVVLNPQRPASTPVPMSIAPSILITIVNTEPAGSGIAFAIDGVAHQAPAGSRQDLAVPPGSYITYDAGGSLGQHRYLISPGLYEFRSTAEGWALYKQASTP
jgi:hypothetical protein